MLLHKKNISVNASKQETVLMNASYNLEGLLDKILENGGSYVFLGDYKNLPTSFNGNDIDILVTDIKIVKKALKKHSFIVRQINKNELKAFIYVDMIEKWVTVDIETIDSYLPAGKRILKYMLDKPIKDHHSSLRFPPENGLVAYKIMKYILNGYLHSWHQIQNLRIKWKNLNKTDQDFVLDLFLDFNLSSNIMDIIILVVSSAEEEIFNNTQLQEFINLKREVRHQNRLVYQGGINKKSLFFSPLLFSLLYFRFFKSNDSLPAIALVGNDGSGKTEQCQRLKDELYKLDPLHVVMRGNEAWLPGWKKVRGYILNYINKRKIEKDKPRSLYIWFLAWVGEIGDFLDRWFRYQVGMAWANAGFGFVLFERYPTDRLRGEYPGPRWSLFPIEQYFPMPDVVVLLDVKEKDSLKRKPNDGHSYQEMHEKRKNYLKLIKEIKPSAIISPKIEIEIVQKQLSRLIWDYSLIKQGIVNSEVELPAKWTPKVTNKTSGRNKQKEGFL